MKRSACYGSGDGHSWTTFGVNEDDNREVVVRKMLEHGSKATATTGMTKNAMSSQRAKTGSKTVINRRAIG